MHNLVSEARSGGYLVNLKCYEILLLRDTTVLLGFDTVLGNKSWRSSHIIAGGLQSEITGYSLS